MIDIVAPSEAFSMLAHHALDSLWRGSDFQSGPDQDLWGCCHHCCAPCNALYSLDQAHHLDYVLSVWKEADHEAPNYLDRMPGGMFHVKRGWMYTQWLSSGVQRANECGHSVFSLAQGDRVLRADILEYARDPAGYLGFPPGEGAPMLPDQVNTVAAAMLREEVAPA